MSTTKKSKTTITKEKTVPDFLTVSEAATRLNCSESYVRYLVRNKEMPSINIGMKGRGTRIPREGFDKFVQARATYMPQD